MKSRSNKNVENQAGNIRAIKNEMFVYSTIQALAVIL